MYNSYNYPQNHENGNGWDEVILNIYNVSPFVNIAKHFVSTGGGKFRKMGIYQFSEALWPIS